MSAPKGYLEEFRRKVLDLLAAGRPIVQIGADLGISGHSHTDSHRPGASDVYPGSTKSIVSQRHHQTPHL